MQFIRSLQNYQKITCRQQNLIKNQSKKINLNPQKHQTLKPYQTIFYCLIITPHVINFKRFIFSDYCEDGDLRKKMKQQLQLNQIIKIFTQIVKGLKYMSSYRKFKSQDIIHRDIKPENILLHKNKIKIADFGLARIIEGDNINQAQKLSLKGTPAYCNPQIFMQKQYSAKCDVWSAGILLYQLIYKKWPFKGKNLFQLFKNIKENVQNKTIQLPQKPNIPQQLKEILQKMLMFQENDRISIQDLSELLIKGKFMQRQKIVLKNIKSNINIIINQNQNPIEIIKSDLEKQKKKEESFSIKLKDEFQVFKNYLKFLQNKIKQKCEFLSYFNKIKVLDQTKKNQELKYKLTELFYYTILSLTKQVQNIITQIKSKSFPPFIKCFHSIQNLVKTQQCQNYLIQFNYSLVKFYNNKNQIEQYLVKRQNTIYSLNQFEDLLKILNQQSSDILSNFKKCLLFLLKKLKDCQQNMIWKFLIQCETSAIYIDKVFLKIDYNKHNQIKKKIQNRLNDNYKNIKDFLTKEYIF